MPRLQRRLTLALAGLVLAVSLIGGVAADRALRARELEHIQTWLGSSARTVAELARELPFDAAHQRELSELALVRGSR